MRVTRRASRRRGGYSVLPTATVSQRGRHAGRGSLFAQWGDSGHTQTVQRILFQVRGYAWMHVIYAMCGAVHILTCPVLGSITPLLLFFM